MEDTTMRKIQYLFVTVVLGLGLTACGDSFLTQYPEGGLLLQEQYEKLSDNLQGSILGIYSKMYEYGGDHDTFGQRSIDMYCDIASGDMAMRKSSYGWFESYERGYFYAYARSYIWGYYYEIIHLANLGALAVEANMKEILNAVGQTEAPREEILMQGFYYGQILALRGWAYAGLLNYYTDPRDAFSADLDADALPIYTEKEVQSGALGAPLSTVAEVYDRVYEDLTMAIELLDSYEQWMQRGDKLEINADVARLILAYAMINHGEKTVKIADGKNAYDIALEKAKEVIDGGNYPMMTKAELLETGFADVSAHNWMWGEDVTVETTTALASFFGQVDIHSYSYAAAGDTKAIDANLYDEIESMGWDARLGWFNAPNEKFPYCPSRKFYNPGTKNETTLDKVDRNWLCDNVFMRVELAYLLAAEAAWSNGDNSTAISYLKQLCSERVLSGQETLFNDWINGLSGSDAVKAALIYNWRVEMWGEGYGLQTLRRLTKTNTLGDNHLSRGGQDVTVESSYYITLQCEIPTSETRYNPYLATTQLTNKN